MHIHGHIKVCQETSPAFYQFSLNLTIDSVPRWLICTSSKENKKGFLVIITGSGPKAYETISRPLLHLLGL